ncbi:MAG: lytic transglycosylase [Deltaproteobacteria bacterium HGW-Deltaproteobacteria-13]|nr:MAG: lytic transglycosylase [Deltaproteobacteria bacterium HGW-Deltaproteobacteria-13]
MNRLYSLLKIFLIIAIITAGAVNGEAQIGWRQSVGQSLIQALKISEPLAFCNEPVPLKEADVKERLEREMLVCLDNSDDVILWLKRSNRYFPYIEQYLKDHSLPDDLKYIVIAESSLKPLAASHKGAVGFWQFIETTGNRYGMKINNDIDERRNFFTSTQAAMAYLKDLHELFGSWTLAAAAYNMGEDGLKTEMLMQKVNNYYQLYLNEETQRYVFRILAVKIILSNPEKYGFHLTEDDLYKPVQFDRIEITVSQPVPLYIIAQAANTYFKVIKDLNPHIKNYSLSAGKHDLLIPRGAASGFSERYGNLLKQWLEEKGKSIYTVEKGDNLSAIASRFHVSMKAIMKWNGITNAKNISPGDKLFIFSDTNTFKPKKNETKTIPDDSVMPPP